MSKRALAFVLVLSGTLWGCAAGPSHDHELRLSLPIDPVSLSPIYAFAQDQIALDLLWCQTLVGLDAHNAPEPILVTRVPSRANGDISADGLQIMYHLRRDVRFADGVPLTSADVDFTYRAILDPVNAAPSVDQYERIASLATPDAHTVVVRLRRPWSAAVHVLFAQADEAYGILPKHAFTSLKVIGSSWDQQPFGSGPFRVSEWQRGDRIELTPNPFFVPKPKLTRIVVRIVPNQTAAFAALRTHEVDAAELNPDNVAEAAAIRDVRLTRTAENGLQGIYLNTAAAPTNDIRVRRAIAFALDYRALRKTWHDLYPPSRSVFPAPVVTWQGPPATPYRHDPRRAERELDLAGWHLIGGTRFKNGLPLRLLVITDTSRPIWVRIAVAVQAQLAEFGADVTIKTYTPALLSAPDGPQRAGRFAVLPSRYIGGGDPEQSLNLLCAEAHGGGGNYSRFCSARLERLFADQMTAPNDARRGRDFAALAAIVRDEIPLIPLYDLLYLEGVDTRVSGYRRNMLRFPIHPEAWDAH